MDEKWVCEIHIKESLDKKWEAFFSPLEMTVTQDGTFLTGFIHDQAELFGILLKIRDLGLTLLNMTPVKGP
jgi:hypothetical protein